MKVCYGNPQYSQTVDVYCDVCCQLIERDCDYRETHEVATLTFEDGCGNGWGDRIKQEGALREQHPEDFYPILISQYLSQASVVLCHDCMFENFDNFYYRFENEIRERRALLLTELIAEKRIPELHGETAERQKLKELEDRFREIHNELAAEDAPGVVGSLVQEAIKINAQIRTLRR
jgi:hypothetical protein